MAKIEQDNRILAELEHTRSTTHGTSNTLLSYFYVAIFSDIIMSYRDRVKLE